MKGFSMAANATAVSQRIGVVGAGQMGIGIAQVSAQSGYAVTLVDRERAICEKALAGMEVQLKKLLEKQKITQDVIDKIKGNITAKDSFKDLSDCDYIIEAATENPELKYKIFKDLDEVAIRPETKLFTNTSSISITAIAAKTKNPARVAGMHFMNPVPVMKLVEGIRAIQTSDETFDQMKTLAEKLGKTFVAVQDIPGFAVNRILMPMINEAVQTVYEGIATVDGIDEAMKLGTNQPMGPLTLADFIGLDTCLSIMQVLHEGLGDSKYRPSPLLKQMVLAGYYGRKTKQGFYDYRGATPVAMKWAKV